MSNRLNKSTETVAMPTAQSYNSTTQAKRNAKNVERVLFVATSNNDGGIERYCVKMGEAMDDRGISLTLACRANGIVERLARVVGIVTIPHRPANSGDLFSAVGLARQIARGKFEIVHSHSRRDFATCMTAVMLLKIFGFKHKPKLILHLHLVKPMAPSNRFMTVIFSRLVDHVLVVSEAVKNITLEGGLVPADRVTVLQNGADLSSYHDPSSLEARNTRTRMRDAWGVSNDDLVIGMVGRLDAKGQARFLPTFADLVSSNPHLKLVLVGGEGAPGFAEHLKAEAREEGVDRNVVFVGATDDVASAMEAFDLLVHLPSDEAFGTVIVEGMAAGLPVVASNVGGCPEIVFEGETGFIVGLNDKAALREVLDRLLDSIDGPAMRHRLGDNARRLALANYSLDKQIDRLIETYDMICETV